jgi:hypothetical protein
MNRSASIRVAALAGVLLLAVVFYVAAAQPRVARWGSTARERQATWPGDSLTPHPGYVWTNAITIRRPANRVWPWLMQWGQGRGGLYSYDWLENAVGCDVQSSDRIMPKHQRPIHTGDQVVRMCRYAPHNPVALVIPGRAVVLGDPSDSTSDLRRGRSRATWAFILAPIDRGRTRLIVRSRGSGMMGRLQGPLQFVMQRRTMRGIEQRAEGSPASTLANLEPLLWLLAGAVFLAASLRVLLQRREWERPLAVAAASVALIFALMFWQPPVLFGAVLDAALAAALIASVRVRRGARA